MAKKLQRRVENRKIVYTTEHWASLERLRLKAIKIMEALKRFHLEPFVHGSIARGDITQKSDIDVVIPYQVSSFLVETALAKTRLQVNKRLVIQATPTYAMKAYIEINENTSISFPLMKMRKVEREFYRFGGEVSAKNLRDGFRVPGVDKRLMLINPTADGHVENTIVGHEECTSKQLGISVETVLDRVHALLRRDEVGRTGVFIEKELSHDETFEKIMKKLAYRNPAVRRRLKAS